MKNKESKNLENVVFSYLIAFLANHDRTEIQMKGILSDLGLSKCAFYYHFESIDDAIDKMKAFYRVKLLEVSNHQYLDGEDAVKNILLYLYENKDYYSIYPNICAITELNSFNEIFVSRIDMPKMPKNLLTDLERKYIEYCMSGIAFIVLKWMENGFKETIGEMLSLIKVSYRLKS